MKTIFCLAFLFCLAYSSYSQSYEYAPGKYQPFQYTGKTDTIKITQKLFDGRNVIMKMKSGNTLNVMAKKGKIIEYYFTDMNGKKTGNNAPVNNTTERRWVCLNCHLTCYSEIDESGSRTGGEICYTLCEPVNCDGKENAGMWVDKRKQN